MFQAFLSRSRDTGPVAPAEAVSLLLLLSDRGDPADLAAGVQAVLARSGLATDWRPGDRWLSVAGPAQAVEAAFGVRVDEYVAPSGGHFYASARPPSLPADLRTLVQRAGRIASRLPRGPRGPRLLSRAAPQQASAAAPPGGLTPPDLLGAYDMKPLRDLGLDGSGETIVFLEYDDFDQHDLDAFTRRFGLPPIRAEVRGKPSQGAEGETTMDLEVAHAIAPGARLVVANHISLRRATDADIVRFHQQVLQQNPGAIFSVSIGYGCDKAFDPTTAQALAQVYDATAALRVPVFVATGDSGAFSCLESTEDWGQPPTAESIGADLLASLPGVTAVGGTRLSAGPGGAWQQEQVWEEPAATGGTGGGISVYLDLPPWQRGPGVRSQVSTGKRQLPDVSAVADASTGVAVVIGGSLAQGGGTSQAAPIWAGMTALINQYLKRQGLQGAGFVNPALYTLAAAEQPYPPFHDVTRGTNLVYPATAGYDLATGLGTPDAWNLARDLEAYYRSGGQ